MIEKAKTMCMYWHAGQKDKSGKEYFEHPFAVAEMVKHADVSGMTYLEYETAICAAYLHDVLEDTDCPISDMYALDEGVAKSVLILTRREGENYESFIRRIATSGNAPAVLVKKADLSHNLSRERRTWVGDDGRSHRLSPSLVSRYEDALDVLIGCQE